MKKLWKGSRLGSFAGVMLLAAFVPARAQDTDPCEEQRLLCGRQEGFSFIGNAGGEYLTIPIGARGVAMGQAFTAVVDDISALWWNPAGLGFMRNPAAFFTNVDMPLDVRFNYVGAGAPVFGGNGVVAGAFGLLQTDEMEVTTVPDPDGTGEKFESWSSNVQGSYAHNISDRFTAGASIKWAHENIFGVTSDAFQFDFGTNYHTTFAGRGIRLAFVVQNLGTNFKSGGARLETQARPPTFPTFPNPGELPLEFRTEEFRPPTTLKTALAYYLVESESSTFIVNGEFAAPRQLETTYSVGGEWTQILRPASNGGIATTVAARAGYHYQSDEEDLDLSPDDSDVLRGLGAGGGVQIDFSEFGTALDYAYRSWGRLGETHNFSVSVMF
jgi:hypothetical protein